MKVRLLAAAFLLGSTALAAAADAIVDEVVVVDTAYNWSGVYVGGQVGYAFGSADYTLEELESGFDYEHDPDGFIGGVYAGYNYQFTNGVVLGGEADIVWGDVEDSSVAQGNDNFSATTSIDWMGAARLRLGYAMGRFLPYVAAGVAFGQFDFVERDEGDFYGEADEDLIGWTLGLGAEYAVTDNWIVRGEYRYTDFDDQDFVEQPVDDDWSAKLRSHDIRLGIAYKF
jgi:outer membrane immunogenic protein